MKIDFMRISHMRDVLVPIFTCCEGYVHIIHSVKFQQCDIYGSTKQTKIWQCIQAMQTPLENEFSKTKLLFDGAKFKQNHNK